MSSVLVEYLATALGALGFRETDFPSPVNETKAARNREELYRQANVAASQTNALLTRGGVDADAPTAKIMPYPGVIRGIAWSLSAVMTGGTLTIQPVINGVAAGPATVLAAANGTSGVVSFPASPPPFGGLPVFAQGDKVGVEITTNGGFLPVTTDLAVDLLLRHNP